MSFSYDISLSTDKDKLRRLLSDTTEARAAFQDEEINGFLGIQSNLFLCASLLAYSRATELASLGIQFTVGAGVRDAVSVDRRQVPKYWMDLANKMEHLAISQDSNYEFWDRLAYDVSDAGIDRSDYQGF